MISPPGKSVPLAPSDAPIDAAADTTPLWLVLLGNLLMLLSFWLIGAGGMAAKLLLIGFWLLVLVMARRQIRITGAEVLGALVFGALAMVVFWGAGDRLEKLRLIGNLMILPLGLMVGRVIGQSALIMIIPAMALFLLAGSSFYLTHEGVRLNHPFLFLGLFALGTVWPGHTGGIAATLAGIGVMLGQTRIAVLAMMINLIGVLNWSRAITWLLLLLLSVVSGWLVWHYLPRLLLTHDSGRLVFWQAFVEMWLSAPTMERWLGFGAGTVEAILSEYGSYAAFGALHNDHFRILFETGIAGAVLWCAGWLIMIMVVRQNRLAVAILISAMVTMMTDNTLNYGHYLMCVGIAAGVASRKVVQDE